MRIKRLGLVMSLLLVGASLLVATGCGDDDSDETSDSGTSGGGEDAAQVVQEAMEADTEFPGPTEGPEAAENKKVVLVSCGMASAGCARPVTGAEEAAKELGWDATICDGQFDPNKYNDCVEQAINTDADAIMLHAISEELVSNPLREARDRGIVVVSTESENVPSETGVNAEIDAKWAQQGEILANYAIDLNGTDQTVLIEEEPSYKAVKTLDDAAKQVLDEAGVAYEEFTFSEADLATTVPDRTVAALQADPNIKTVINFDDAILQIIPAVRGAGLAEQVDLLGYNLAAISEIRDGGMTGSVGAPQPWEGWAAIDNINRVLQGEEPVDQNVPLRLFTVDNIEELQGDTWDGDVDYQSEYLGVWGVE